MCIALVSIAQDMKPNIVVENLKQEWLVSSVQNSNFSPYVKEIHSPVLIHFYLNLNKYKEYYLSLDIPDNTSLFIENKIVGFYENAQTKNFPIDSLLNEYGLNHILITIFSEENLPEVLLSNVVDFSPKKNTGMNKVDFSSPVRMLNDFNDFNLLSVLLIIILGISIRTSQEKLFKEYFNVRKIFTLNFKSEALYSVSFLSTQNLISLLYYGLIVGFSITNFVVWITPDSILSFWDNPTLGSLVFAIILSLAVTFIMVLKYPMLILITNIFVFRKATTIHYYEYLRFSFIISLMLFILSIINNVYQGILISNFTHQLGWLLVFLVIARSIFIYLKLIKLKSFRKLHLFSYLCSTEIIPLIILLKFFNNI